MTQPTPPSPSHDRRFARDVARQLDRRRIRRRLTMWSALLALIIAGAAYLRLGGGFGKLGLGGQAGDGDEERRPLAGPPRCRIRVSASEITLDGHPTSRDAAIAHCKGAPGVDIFPTGDARHGEPADLDAALKAAGATDVVVHPLPTRSPDTPPSPSGSAGPK
ncbi:MAG TPA: hypothetical protein VHT91_04670 [Kofleriaceae bacterium]|jgi:hypothetical protein|nr:hypothetical protein [Kofleriaceae bacterium]